jgi:hypothetical protein
MCGRESPSVENLLQIHVFKDQDDLQLGHDVFYISTATIKMSKTFSPAGPVELYLLLQPEEHHCRLGMFKRHINATPH